MTEVVGGEATGGYSGWYSTWELEHGIMVIN
jgi:hypothetical protein